MCMFWSDQEPTSFSYHGCISCLSSPCFVPRTRLGPFVPTVLLIFTRTLWDKPVLTGEETGPEGWSDCLYTVTPLVTWTFKNHHIILPWYSSKNTVLAVFYLSFTAMARNKLWKVIWVVINIKYWPGKFDWVVSFLYFLATSRVFHSHFMLCLFSKVANEASVFCTIFL